LNRNELQKHRQKKSKMKINKKSKMKLIFKMIRLRKLTFKFKMPRKIIHKKIKTLYNSITNLTKTISSRTKIIKLTNKNPPIK